ncbi:AMP-binding protein [Amycolatopsis acidiphila]|uniref:AMP-binding protein n=1 Tax=Amycolatopsis acidiphila TaxID=715473 RepID=A0A558A2Z3_9PSEU|nr:AMP-binding protein [Amycolatopsis acidiphila]TVT18623.1 AMP-binding protein [Amycolatopsis acidiphila]UIJ56604.1 AMP-binding protein [Amycolatopsis acidiphila]GHG66428.1 4-chlorobenzoate--CoA ligase [Amycolatopsis acidiphila]
MDLGTVLRWTAERYPARRAVGGPHPMSYAEWDAHTNRLARALARLGVRRGDRVVLSLAGGEPLASLHFALQKLGAVSVPLSFRFGAAELAYCVADAAPVMLVTDESTEAVADEALADLPPLTRVRSGAAAGTIERLAPAEPDTAPDATVSEEDISVLLYTSGTTGKPKGVPRSHRAEHAAAIAHLVQTGQPLAGAALGVMPMFHTMGLRTLVATVAAAGTWVPQVRFDAEEALELIVAERVRSLYLVPTIYWSLVRTGRLAEAKSVRKLAYAGASMTPALAEQLCDALEPESFVNHFGSTEIYTFTIGPDVAAKPGSAGRAGLFSRVRLIDPDPAAGPDDVVVPGQQGQLAVSMGSPEAFGGYWRRPDANGRSIRGGWYFPGDLAVEDEDGDLWVAGRVDDMINSGGENIYPDEIEDALIRCPVVRAVVVVGLPDDRWGQAATAFFVPEEGTTAEHAMAVLELFAREQSGLPSLKRPKRLIAVDALPQSAVGKILRRELTSGHYRALADSTTKADR